MISLARDTTRTRFDLGGGRGFKRCDMPVAIDESFLSFHRLCQATIHIGCHQMQPSITLEVPITPHGAR